MREGIGELVAAGRTSDVHAYGANSVVKVPHSRVPDQWAAYEARLSEIVHSAGVPAPAVLDVIQVKGRDAIVFEWVRGPSMWQQMVADPAKVARLTTEMAAVQRSLLSVGPLAGIPDFSDRLARRIAAAKELGPSDRADAARLAEALPRGAALLHGDLHPGNVLMSANGPIVIDWFDVSIGHPVADMVRTSILVRPRAAAPAHLPDATPAVLRAIHDGYLASFDAEFAAAEADLGSWQALTAAARLAEGAEINHARLLELWAGRTTDAPRGRALLAGR